MDNNSTQLLTFDKIEINEIDLFEDAFRFEQSYADIINMLSKVVYKPDNKVVMRIITDL